MTAETDISTLLNNLTPVASDETYVFVSAEFARLPVEVFQHAKGMFKEMEGTTFILEQQYAESLGLSYEGCFCCITCEVHSSLEAVGMTAAMTTALGEAGISVNPPVGRRIRLITHHDVTAGDIDYVGEVLKKVL